MILTGLPISSFFVHGQFSSKTPEYAVRIGMIFLTAGTSLAMLMNLIFTDSNRQHLSPYKYFLLLTNPKKQKFSMYQLEYASQSISNNRNKNNTKHLIDCKLNALLIDEYQF